MLILLIQVSEIDLTIIYNFLLLVDFPTPMPTYSFVLETDVIILCVSVQVSEMIFVLYFMLSNFQTFSECVVPTRSYRYTNLTGSLSSMMSFTGDMFEIALPGVDGGHVVNVTVMFERGPCTSAAIASFTGER